MLGVLKRRWKPKRGVSNNNINNINNNNNATRRQSKTDSSMQVDIARTATSPRAIHPVTDEKAALVVAYGVTALGGSGGGDPSAEAVPSGGSVYPLAPNICVEAGRIEFIKPTQDSATSPNLEKADPAKEWLERRVAQLEEALEEERKGIQRERMLTAKLQRQISRREVAQRDVDRERRLRCESEARLRSSLSEADRCRTRLTALQKEFTRMEDTVRSMLQYKSKYELLKHEKASLTLAFESKVQQFQSALNKLSHENEQLKKQLRTVEATGSGKVVERLQELERDNSVLSEEGEVQRRQYERCLDDVANQVVRALLAQKGLREEIGSLHRRIKDLETQNRALSTLLIQQLQQGATPVTPCSLLAPSQDKPTKATVTLALPGVGRSHGRPVSCDEGRLRTLWGVEEGCLSPSTAAAAALVWLPIQRPRSLNLDSCCQYRAHRTTSTSISSRPPSLTSPLTGGSVSLKKSGGGGGGEDEGSESPESGNRDEGYSTMSSDVQGPLEAPRRGLEDLKEATDETESAAVPIDCSTPPDRMLDVPESSDLVLIPVSVAVAAANTRHSFPPVEDLLPFQHIMRSFSDSHLCLKLTPNSPSPSYSLTSAESLFLFGDKSQQPLRRSRATTSLLCTAVQEEEDDSGSWSSVDNWDTDYIQHWLRLDETRSQLQQQMEYDAAELEDWTMEETEFWRRCEAITPNQSHLPSIQETNASELEEDSNECLWNGSSYLVDMSADTSELAGRCLWPTSARCLISPGGDSWSSVGTNSEDSKSCNDNCQNGSKRSSTAMSTDSGESPAIGTDFTRDFYRLVKFESTKSLASTSSRSDNVGLKRTDLSFTSDREQALQSVLHFIAEQQQYCLSREVQDHPNENGFDVSPVKNVSNSDENENKNEFIEGFSCVESSSESKLCSKPNECCDTNCLKVAMPEISSTNTEENEDLKLVQSKSENVDMKNDDFSNDGINDCLDLRHKDVESSDKKVMDSVCDVNSCCNVRLGSKEQFLPNDISCSSVSDSKSDKNVAGSSFDGVVEGETRKEVQKEVKSRDSLLEQPSLIPRLIRPEMMTSIQKPSSFLGPVPEEDEDHCSVSTTDSVPKSPQILKSPKRFVRRTLESASGPSSDTSVLVTDSKTLGFHERASSKDVIDELNRMIRKGEDSAEVEPSSTVTNLDMGCCCPTGWVHVERDIDFTDPKARANLLDVMLAASRSSSSSESASASDGGNSSDDDEEADADEPPDYQHLHRIHRFRRQKKASASREPLGALRCPSSAPRPSIIGRDDFFVRYGEKEREAVASFDFLEELSTTSISGASSCDNNPSGVAALRGDSPPMSRSHSQTPDPDIPEHLSLSDSCAGSFSGSELSLENQ